MLLVLFVGLVFRAFGVFLATLGTDMSYKGRLFCLIATIPKATVQASIGGIPLALGVKEGAYIQTAGVLAVAIFAPIGVTIIGMTVDKCGAPTPVVLASPMCRADAATTWRGRRLVGTVDSALPKEPDAKVDIVTIAERRITYAAHPNLPTALTRFSPAVCV